MTEHHAAEQAQVDAPARRPLVRLSGLWEEIGRDGLPYWYGLTNNRRHWYIFRNKAARSPFDPPWILFEVGGDDGEA